MTSDGSRNFTTMTRPPRELPFSLAPDEQVMLSSQGGYRDHVRSGWRLGTLYLTNKRLLFCVQTGVVFETQLSEIHDVSVEKQKYVGGRIKDVIVVVSRPAASPRVSVACVIMADLATWRDRLREITLPEIDQYAIEWLMDELDPDSSLIVGHLWEHRHATASELAEVIGASSKMDVLLRIRDDINPAAQRAIGGPLLVFEEARVDGSTGEKVPFSWWLVGQMGGEREESREPFVDIHDEGDHLDILVELLGAREEDILIGVGGNRLTVWAEDSERSYREEIPLPPGVCSEKFSKSYANGILSISLQKLES